MAYIDKFIFKLTPSPSGFNNAPTEWNGYLDDVNEQIVIFDNSTNSELFRIGGGNLPFGNDTGVADAYQTAISGATLTDGYAFEIKIANTNTGASTLQINALGVLPFVDGNGDPLTAGEIEVGSIYIATYNSTFGGYQLLGLAKPNTAITNNVIPKGTGAGINDGTWEFAGNDIIPTTTGSNIGDGTHRIGTIFMSSIIDYASDLVWMSTSERMRLSSTGVLTSKSADGDFIVGTVDAFARRQVWVNYTNGLLRMGSDAADGDPSDINSEGIVVFHPSDDRASRIKADRFGLTTALDTSLYYFRADPSALFYKDALLNTIFRADRTTTNVSIGLSGGTAKLHIQGVDATNGNFALKAENIATSNLYSISNNGRNVWNSYFDGISGGIANNSYNTNTGGILNEYTSVDGFKASFIEGVTLRGAFVNAGGFCQLHAQHRFTLKDNGNISKLWMDSVNGYIGIGAGYFAAGSQLHVQAASATNADFALKLEDNVGGILMHVRADSRISIPNVQTGNAGLASGDLYVDTAANILVNGDVIVARKV